MRTVHKFPFEVADTVTLELPKRAIILHVAVGSQHEHGRGVLWAEVDTDQPMERRALYCRGTGHPLPEARASYLGTFQDGSFFWHIYEPVQPTTRDGMPARPTR